MLSSIIMCWTSFSFCLAKHVQSRLTRLKWAHFKIISGFKLFVMNHAHMVHISSISQGWKLWKNSAFPADKNRYIYLSTIIFCLSPTVPVAGASAKYRQNFSLSFKKVSKISLSVPYWRTVSKFLPCVSKMIQSFFLNSSSCMDCKGFSQAFGWELSMLDRQKL